jgi:hypothetical protein
MKRVPSRFMPRYERPRTGPWAWVFLAVLATGAVYLLLQYPVGTICAALALVALGLFERRRHRAKLAELVAFRSGSSICEFARAFERHSVDPWVVRAVYEQLQAYLGDEYRVPIRASDEFGRELPIDAEDLEMDIILEIAQRTGRSLNDAERNPFYGKVNTVRDLVLFFNAQGKAI